MDYYYLIALLHINRRKMSDNLKRKRVQQNNSVPVLDTDYVKVCIITVIGVSIKINFDKNYN